MTEDVCSICGAAPDQEGRVTHRKMNSDEPLPKRKRAADILAHDEELAERFENFDPRLIDGEG